MISIHANNNNKHHSKVSNRTKPASAITKVDRNEEELWSSFSEDESSSVSVEEIFTAGAAPNAVTSLLISLSNVSCDNIHEIQRLHYELLKLLQPKSMIPITTCNYLLHPEKIELSLNATWFIIV